MPLSMLSLSLRVAILRSVQPYPEHSKAGGRKFVTKILENDPNAITPVLETLFAREGKIIQELLTRKKGTTVSELLENFSLNNLASELQNKAPNIWKALTVLSENPTRKKGVHRNQSLVFATICAMVSILRSQKANNFQAVISMFLIGCGSAKREMEVLAHAGLCLSYTATMKHLRALSAEATAKYRAVIRSCMCSIVWDNLNIAFRVGEQRLNSGNHFDNGTTATLLKLWDPYLRSMFTAHGTLPLTMKPPRTSANPRFEFSDDQILPSPQNITELTDCCIWQLKRIALENIGGLEHLKKAFEACPEVDQIHVHVTEQFSLPAMHEEESSIEGTIRIYVMILRHLGVTNADLEKHGLLFNDGDLLTDNLVDKVEAARRNSEQPIEGMKAAIRRFGIFHAKMAGCRLVINEHWGKPNSKHPGSGLWWENNYLNQKNIVAGWQSSKAAPWKPSHELLQISLAAHVVDGFRLFCGQDDLDQWAQRATKEDFNRVTEEVYNNLFSTHAYHKLRKRPHRDTTFENAILYNRDALIYIEIVHAIKAGDIGRVVNVFKVWMVMMRSKKTMPKYADAIFETLGRLATYPEKLRKFFLHNWLVNLTGKPNSFKEIDLLQEHQNFWAKVIYNAKGSNRSWDWLSMITVCIYELRNAMRTVQKNFEISSFGTQHTIPDMTKEVMYLVQALKDNRIQSYVENRETNQYIDPKRDLLEDGSKNLGQVEATVGDSAEAQEESEATERDDYEITLEDLAVDNEEPYGDFDNIMSFIDAMD
ncbi:hypothetical protein BT96DRAFT_959055 [Gymnopus androsaceus JB14]|uniref:DUF6589 domain-containing protein n=1 Tax=Gymnopus androsaceus JB14 TaxID=1447944 RepID=A0A6A4H8E0_9AGAR|nr:hypothetical protein BT96DRAFT_959055 [Gymnopus androsaceus JB14]